MRTTFAALLLLLTSCFSVTAQSTFKCGWNTYKTGFLVHEYTYTISGTDSIKLYLTDSAQTFVSADSLVTMCLHTPLHDRSIYKTANFLSAKKQLLRTEEYKDDNLLATNEWRYDEKNRKVCHVEDNKVSGNNFKKLYEYASEKKTGATVVTESAYFNGKIEFYTRAYYDRNSVKLKEVRLNDNNKDVVHIETYTYGENGKVKERSVYFPEWKVTRKFEEKEGNQVAKCYKSLPVGTKDPVNLSNRINFMKQLLKRNMALISDKDCHEFEYKFSNFTTCEIVVATTNVNNTKKVIFRYKEKF